MVNHDSPSGLVLDPEEQADVIVVCVTYNSSHVIQALLDALPAALEGVSRCRVVIIDNDSGDGTPEMVRELAPWALLVPAGRNVGYAGAINIALRHRAAARGVYVLNPDTLPSPRSVVKLLDATEMDPLIGIATPRILGANGHLQFSLRREPTITRALGEALLGGTRASRIALLGETIGDPTQYRDGACADWATGAAMFITSSAISAVGEWDERFFLYSEETDYSLRVRDAGYRLHFVEHAEVVHQGGDQATSPHLWALSAVNRTRLYRKRHARASSTVFWAVVLLNEASRALVGRSTHRAAVRALLAAGPNHASAEPTPSVLARAVSSAL